MASTAAPKEVSIDQLVGAWELDTNNSEIRIKHKTMWGLVTVKGHFRSFNGNGSVSADGTVAGSVTIDPATIDTKNKKRDDHLRSDDFFDVHQFPSIAFQVSGATVRDGQVEFRSDLAIKGIHQPLTFSGQIEETTADTLTLTGAFPVDRGRFNMSWNQAGMMKGLATVSFRMMFHRAKS